MCVLKLKRSKGDQVNDDVDDKDDGGVCAHTVWALVITMINTTNGPFRRTVPIQKEEKKKFWRKKNNTRDKILFYNFLSLFRLSLLFFALMYMLLFQCNPLWTAERSQNGAWDSSLVFFFYYLFLHWFYYILRNL